MLVFGKHGVIRKGLPSFLSVRSFLALVRKKPLFRGGSVLVLNVCLRLMLTGYPNHVASDLCCFGMQRFMSDTLSVWAGFKLPVAQSFFSQHEDAESWKFTNWSSKGNYWTDLFYYSVWLRFIVYSIMQFKKGSFLTYRWKKPWLWFGTWDMKPRAGLLPCWLQGEEDGCLDPGTCCRSSV